MQVHPHCRLVSSHRINLTNRALLTQRDMQSTKFMLGIITAVIASNWLGDLVHSDGIYESDLEADGSVVYLRQTAPSSLTLQPARQIMSSETWYARVVGC